MRGYPDTLPRSITPQLEAFCQTICPGRPLFINSKPAAGAQVSSCFDNVNAHVARHGGSVEYGWAIWHMRGAYFEAEHHGVWCNPIGRLTDVSPQVNDYRSILFLPDAAAVYDPRNFRSNKLQAEPGSRAGAAIVELASRRQQIIDGYRVGGTRLGTLSWRDQFEVASIDDRLRPLLAAIGTG